MLRYRRVLAAAITRTPATLVRRVVSSSLTPCAKYASSPGPRFSKGSTASFGPPVAEPASADRAVDAAPRTADGVGAVVELDRRLEDPIDLYVNGLRLGHGELEIVDEEWAVRVDAVTGLGEPAVALG